MVKKFKEKLMAAQLCGANKNVMIYLQKISGKILYTNLSLNKMLYNNSSKIAIRGLCDKY